MPDTSGAGPRQPPRSVDDDAPAAPAPPREALVAGAGPELLEDGQEEVFSYTAVEAGLVADPKALGPEDLDRLPKSPGPITSS